MDLEPTSPSMLRAQLTKYTTALSAFTSSTQTFRILHSLASTTNLPPPKTLYILDSSFNPPTRAHLQIATSALLSSLSQAEPQPTRLLLLLATQNADKAPKPASFPQRLLMMQLFAQDLLSTLASSSPQSRSADHKIGIDIGVTTLPYFVDKSKAIGESDSYPGEPEQVHLTGYDTLVRILNPKYYPPEHTLGILGPFLERHRLRVTYRTDDSWGSREEQDKYLEDIREGKREGEMARREWVEDGRIVLVEGRKAGEEIISSTRVRKAVQDNEKALLKNLVTASVAGWILDERPYSGDQSNEPGNET